MVARAPAGSYTSVHSGSSTSYGATSASRSACVSEQYRNRPLRTGAVGNGASHPFIAHSPRLLRIVRWASSCDPFDAAALRREYSGVEQDGSG